MIFSRRKGCWFILFAVFLNRATCSPTDQFQDDGFTARKIFKNWWKKNQQSEKARLFRRLPQNAESKYTPPKVIENRGYTAEIHHVTTDDGYILELHRIPAKVSGRKVVFLQHGVLQSSGTWLVNPSSRSLAILLADKGYDVWLGNARGNRYSRAHSSLNTRSSQYWKFSWDELGNYDIPAVINFILTKTGQSKLSYIGHSLGCGMFFIAMLKHPELNSKIEIMVALAPLSSFAHFNSFLTTFTRYTNPIERFLKSIGFHGWLDSYGFGNFLLKLVCEQTYSQARLCKDAFNFVAGPNRDNFDEVIIPAANYNFLMGTSVSVIAHFAQNYNAGEVFRAYDYGHQGNLNKYGSTTPTDYDLTQITAPIYVFSGGNDYIVAPQDVDWLLTKLKNLKGSTRLSDYNHLDFIWGTDVKERLYDQVIALLPSP